MAYLYRHAMEAFGHYHPNSDPKILATAVCATKGWTVAWAISLKLENEQNNPNDCSRYF